MDKQFSLLVCGTPKYTLTATHSQANSGGVCVYVPNSRSHTKKHHLFTAQDVLVKTKSVVNHKSLITIAGTMLLVLLITLTHAHHS